MKYFWLKLLDRLPFHRNSTTQKNYLKFTNKQTVFETVLGSTTRMPEIGSIEAKNAAKVILKKKKDVVLCLSGGIDSEVMLRSFMLAGGKFSICFLRFRHGLNDFDIDTNLKIVRQLKLEHQILELDVIDFFESGRHLEYAKKYQCISPQLAVHLWMLEQIKGTPVLAGNPMFPAFPNPNQLFFVGLPGMLHAVYFKFFEINKRPGVPWFLMYTPELAAAFLNHSCVDQSLQEQWGIERYDYSTKCQIYKDHGFEVSPRVNKFTGFELVRRYYDTKFGTNWGIGFDTAFRRPMEQMVKTPSQLRQLVPVRYLRQRDRLGGRSTA